MQEEGLIWQDRNQREPRWGQAYAFITDFLQELSGPIRATLIYPVTLEPVSRPHLLGAQLLSVASLGQVPLIS